MRRSLKIGSSAGGFHAALPLSCPTLTYVSRAIRQRRAQLGSPTRRLHAGQRALLVLAYLRKGETFGELAAGFGIASAPGRR